MNASKVVIRRACPGVSADEDLGGAVLPAAYLLELRISNIPGAPPGDAPDLCGCHPHRCRPAGCPDPRPGLPGEADDHDQVRLGPDQPPNGPRARLVLPVDHRVLAGEFRGQYGRPRAAVRRTIILCS